MNKGNHARAFNSIMPLVNEKWASKVLGVPLNLGNGPDLVDQGKIIEIKFKLMLQNEYTHICWRILGHQRKYLHTEKKAYWGLGQYWMSKPVSEIKTKNLKELEQLVLRREMYIVDWNWVNQFPSYFQEGQTDKSQWSNELIFAKARLLPPVKATYEVSGGLVHLTDGIDEQSFGNINSIKQNYKE